MGEFKKLRVWKEALSLSVDIYKLTKNNRFSKDFGLKDQIQRAAVSVASNIAEGDERKSNKEASRFFYIAKGSIADTITQLNIAFQIGYIDKDIFNDLENKADKISASLMNLIKARKNEFPKIN